MAIGNITTTSVDAFVPEVWSKEIIYQTTNASIFASLSRRDFDGEIENKGDTVHIPLLSAISVGDKSGNSPVDYTNYSESTKDILINKHKYFAFRVEDIARIQAQPDLIAGYAAQGGRGLANSIDKDIAGLANDAAITQNVGTTTAGAYDDISDAVIRAAIQELDEANAPETDRYLVISPAQKNALLGIDKFVSADKVGDANVIRKGLFGQIYGVLVYVSNNLLDVALVASSAGGPLVPAHKACMMFHKEAFALCTQLQPRVQAAYDLDYLATSVVGDVLYGSGILVPEFAVQVRTTTEV
ncbi:phage capsid protein [Thermodesulfobacteriota bacterium]